VPEGAFGLLKAENIASARIYGVEASVDARGYGFDVRAAYTGLVTFDDDPSVDPSVPLGSAARPPLPGRPGQDFVGDVAYSLGPVRFRYGVDFIGSLYADKEGSVPVPSRLLQSTGVRIAVPWVRTLRLAFDVHNLFDVRTGFSPGFMGMSVREPIGDEFAFPLPGRSFLFAVRWSPGGRDEAM
jgi:outer membrane receptor protein involved in Fe transport